MMESSDSTQVRRGEIWLVAFGAGRTGEPTKNRPALIWSADGQLSQSVYDLIIIAPISSSLSETLTRPVIAADPETGLEEDSVVVLRAIRGLSPSRLIRRLGSADDEIMENLGLIMAALLDLPL